MQLRFILQRLNWAFWLIVIGAMLSKNAVASLYATDFEGIGGFVFSGGA